MFHKLNDVLSRIYFCGSLSQLIKKQARGSMI